MIALTGRWKHKTQKKPLLFYILAHSVASNVRVTLPCCCHHHHKYNTHSNSLRMFTFHSTKILIETSFLFSFSLCSCLTVIYFSIVNCAMKNAMNYEVDIFEVLFYYHQHHHQTNILLCHFIHKNEMIFAKK